MDLKTLTHLPTLFKTSERVINDHAPAILTIAGVIGTVSTAVLTAKASFKAVDRLHEATIDKANEFEGPITNPNDVALTKREMIEKVWTLYMPAVGVGALSCAAIIGANHVNAKRIAVVTAAYSLSEKNFTEYKEKAEEHLGINKKQKVKDEIASDRVARDLDRNDNVVIVEGSGKVLLHDAYSGRPFPGTIEDVRKAVNDINRNLLREDSQTVSDFYDMIGLKHTSLSDEMGWNQAEPLEISWTTIDPGNGMPAAHSFDFESRPILRPWSSASFR